MTRVFLTIVILAVLSSVPVSAQTPDLRLPVIVDAESTDYDGRTSMTMFKGLRLTQGNIGIVADLAQTNRMDFDDSVWQFSGNVAFDMEEGHVTCDSADLRFSEFQLQVATITGSPATFEFRRLESDQTTYAEAERLYYDVVAGTIEFSGGATITEGGNVISSETLVYNFREQRISASGNGDERVTVTYTPPEADESAGENAGESDTDDEASETDGTSAEEGGQDSVAAEEPAADDDDGDSTATEDGSE
ncbi:MAG: LptA/OstA family protein [Woeseiaceae bacterium]|nr:LptA/OstA family protein [Woeseiaceae bacterium]